MNISNIQPHEYFKGNGADSFWYQFCSGKLLSKEQLKDMQSILSKEQSVDAIGLKEFSEWFDAEMSYTYDFESGFFYYKEDQDGDNPLTMSDLYLLFKSKK